MLISSYGYFGSRLLRLWLEKREGVNKYRIARHFGESIVIKGNLTTSLCWRSLFPKIELTERIRMWKYLRCAVRLVFVFCTFCIIMVKIRTLFKRTLSRPSNARAVNRSYPNVFKFGVFLTPRDFNRLLVFLLFWLNTAFKKTIKCIFICYRWFRIHEIKANANIMPWIPWIQWSVIRNIVGRTSAHTKIYFCLWDIPNIL